MCECVRTHNETQMNRAQYTPLEAKQQPSNQSTATIGARRSLSVFTLWCIFKDSIWNAAECTRATTSRPVSFSISLKLANVACNG